ncbi:MAG: hypothetical protein EP315_02655, partial [Gammaproteobacteria bacterium]
MVNVQNLLITVVVIMQSNPLIVPLLHLLRTQPGPISEYDLMQLLEQSGVQFPIEAETRDLELFRKHFFLKNALYQLQAELIDEGMYVRIGMLDISLEPVSNGRDRQELSEQGEAKVRNYYLDWNNYSTTGDQEVKQLLQSFWERYFALDQHEQA